MLLLLRMLTEILISRKDITAPAGFHLVVNLSCKL